MGKEVLVVESLKTYFELFFDFLYGCGYFLFLLLIVPGTSVCFFFLLVIEYVFEKCSDSHL